jgi:hypothetical protein
VGRTRQNRRGQPRRFYFCRKPRYAGCMNRSALACLALFSLNPCAAAERQVMDSADILAALPGMTMTGNYADGTKFTETYHPDKAVTYQDDRGADTGNWFEKDGLFCTFYVSLQGACFKVVRTGANCYEYYVAEGQDGTKSVPSANWNSVGWDIKHPSTCDLSDKVV